MLNAHAHNANSCFHASGDVRLVSDALQLQSSSCGDQLPGRVLRVRSNRMHHTTYIWHWFGHAMQKSEEGRDVEQVRMSTSQSVR